MLNSLKMRVDGGRWGVAQGCDCQHMLSAIASLIRAQRCEIALLLLEEAFPEHR